MSWWSRCQADRMMMATEAIVEIGMRSSNYTQYISFILLNLPIAKFFVSYGLFAVVAPPWASTMKIWADIAISYIPSVATFLIGYLVAISKKKLTYNTHAADCFVIFSHAVAVYKRYISTQRRRYWLLDWFVRLRHHFFFLAQYLSRSYLSWWIEMHSRHFLRHDENNGDFSAWIRPMVRHLSCVGDISSPEPHSQPCTSNHLIQEVGYLMNLPNCLSYNNNVVTKGCASTGGVSRCRCPVLVSWLSDNKETISEPHSCGAGTYPSQRVGRGSENQRKRRFHAPTMNQPNNTQRTTAKRVKYTQLQPDI